MRRNAENPGTRVLPTKQIIHRLPRQIQPFRVEKNSEEIVQLLPVDFVSKVVGREGGYYVRVPVELIRFLGIQTKDSLLLRLRAVAETDS